MTSCASLPRGLQPLCSHQFMSVGQQHACLCEGLLQRALGLLGCQKGITTHHAANWFPSVCVCVQGIWPDTLGFCGVLSKRCIFLSHKTAYCPQTFQGHMQGVRYAPWKWRFTKVGVCHGFYFPPFRIIAGSKRVKNSNLHELFNTSPNSTKLTFIAPLKRRHGIWLRIVWTVECQYK